MLLPILWYYVTESHLSPANLAFMNMLCVVAHIILRDFRSSESFQTVSVTSAVTAVIWNLPHIKLFIGKHVIEWGFVFFMVMINISMYILFFLSESI